MSKIINAKSQIGKTEKCESEMMLEFEFRDGLISGIRKNKLAVCTIDEIGELFWISADCDSCELRQIADKLDELNGVELPEFLKEQA